MESATPTDPSRRWTRASVTGAIEANRDPARRLSGATSTSARPLSIAEATASGDRMTLARSYLTLDWCSLELGRVARQVLD